MWDFEDKVFASRGGLKIGEIYNLDVLSKAALIIKSMSFSDYLTYASHVSQKIDPANKGKYFPTNIARVIFGSK